MERETFQGCFKFSVFFLFGKSRRGIDPETSYRKTDLAALAPVCYNLNYKGSVSQKAKKGKST